MGRVEHLDRAGPATFTGSEVSPAAEGQALENRTPQGRSAISVSARARRISSVIVSRAAAGSPDTIAS